MLVGDFYSGDQDFKHKLVSEVFKEFLCKDLLDVGFADVPNKYLGGRVFGVDRRDVPTPKNYEFVVQSDLDEDGLRRFGDGGFDGVACCDVLEHLRGPGFLLGEVCRVLRPGGILVLTLPNVYCVNEVFTNVFGLYKKRWRDLEHLCSFNPNNLLNLLEGCGFVVVGFKGFRFKVPGLDFSVNGRFVPWWLSSQVFVVCQKKEGGL